MIRTILIVLALAAAGWAQAQTVTKRLSGLDEPWAIGFLPSGGLLVTERDGRLLLASDGQMRTVRGVPRVAANGQGGLLDVAVARDFAQSQTIFLTYAEPVRGGARTALASARLDESGGRLSDLQVLFAQEGPRNGGRHFGSRVVEAADGTLFVTVGDRGARNEAQNTQVHSGKVVRVSREGAVPADNPASENWLPEIWSTGHRNPQGAALDAQGRLWTVEHGARGGDEINRPEAGRNYGWPRISYGVHYSGARIGEGTQAPGLEQPAFYWDPSIAPSGMMIYSGKLWPEWEGDIFVGSLKFDMISRLEVSGDTAREVERLFQDEYYRIRDVREAPDGSIWFLSVGDGAAYQVTP
ncbi:MAG: PQQ-dependent sugar dehydrogenase [Pseudomonadota bacterium]